MNDTRNKDFIIRLSKLKTAEVVGVLKILGVKLMEASGDTYIQRDPADMLRDAVISYSNLKRKQRRELDRVMKSAARNGKEEENGASAEDSRDSGLQE